MKGHNEHNAFARRLRERRDELGLSQRAIAKRAGLTGGRIGQYETSDGYPHVSKIQQIAEAYELDGFEVYQLVVAGDGDDVRSAAERIPGYVNRLTFALSDYLHTIRVYSTHGSPDPLASPA